MSDERCDECGCLFTDDYQAFQEQHKPGKEPLCMPIQNFGGYQLCAERAVDRLKARISALETLAHAAIGLRGWQTTAPVDVLERFDAAVKGAGL